MTTGRILAAVAAAISLIFVTGSIASAQYPPPKGSVVCQIAESKVVINGNITLSVTLRDTAGNIMIGQLINFSIVQNNGTAYLSNNQGVTDGSGTAYVTIYVGAGTGTLIVNATSDGLECRASLEVFSIPTPPTPQIEILTIRPPDTGSAGLAGGKDIDPMLASVAVVLTVVASGGLLMLVRRPEGL